MVDVREVKDIDSLMSWRTEVIRTVFGVEADSDLLEANRQYYIHHVDDGTHYAVVASSDGIDCGCGGICLTEELPSPDNPTGKCAYLMNIYVRKEFRNHGVAHTIVSRLVDQAQEKGCGKIYLETTADGKPVYTSLGFCDMADMMKYYDKAN
ncbi:MAG: GNAT family N-acetyltransferase [Muribaculaceae bacterium]|nr:GNAT family N-acetyltransferase [Muribaculaceae bacterium]